jgi:hypothetical protein
MSESEKPADKPKQPLLLSDSKSTNPAPSSTSSVPILASDPPIVPPIHLPPVIPAPTFPFIKFETKEAIVLAIGSLLSLAALRTNDPYLFFPCFGLAWVGFIYIALIHKGSRLYRALFSIFITVFFIYVACRSYDSSVSVPSALLTSQLQELEDLQNFIGAKNEYELDETFDLRRMAVFNTALAVEYIAPQIVSPEQSAKISNYFAHGSAMADRRYCYITYNKNGVSRLNFIPGKLPLLDLSSQYSTARQKLVKFESSAEMPPKVAGAIKDFDNTIQSNTVILLDVINEKLAQDTNNIIQNDDPKSPNFGAVSLTYNHRIIPLEPRADEVIKQIKTYLKSIK